MDRKIRGPDKRRERERESERHAHTERERGGEMCLMKAMCAAASMCVCERARALGVD